MRIICTYILSRKCSHTPSCSLMSSVASTIMHWNIAAIFIQTDHRPKYSNCVFLLSSFGDHCLPKSWRAIPDAIWDSADHPYSTGHCTGSSWVPSNSQWYSQAPLCSILLLSIPPHSQDSRAWRPFTLSSCSPSFIFSWLPWGSKFKSIPRELMSLFPQSTKLCFNLISYIDVILDHPFHNVVCIWYFCWVISSWTEVFVVSYYTSVSFTTTELDFEEWIRMRTF